MLWTNSALLSEAAVKIDRCLKRFATFTGKHLCRSLFLITLQVFSHATVFKKSPQHGCFPVNIAKCLRTASFEHLRWLLLYFGQLLNYNHALENLRTMNDFSFNNFFSDRVMGGSTEGNSYYGFCKAVSDNFFQKVFLSFIISILLAFS